METEKAISNTTQIKSPQEIAAQPLPEISFDLEAAAKIVMDQIRHCDEQALQWQERKRGLQMKWNEMLTSVQKQFDTEEKKEIFTARTKTSKSSTVPELIRNFLEKSGPTRTKEIRKFLLQQGKRTNPGVALSRLVKSGDLKNVERGVYKIA